MTTPFQTTQPSRVAAWGEGEARPAAAPAAVEQTLAPGERVVIPSIREEAEVHTRAVETGRVHIAKQVVEREEIVSVPVASEHVRVERVPIGRTVDAMPQVRLEGDTTIIPVVEEVVVVERRLLLKEEIRVTRERAVSPSPPQRVTLRSESVRVEREGPPGALAPLPTRAPKGLPPRPPPVFRLTNPKGECHDPS